MAPSSRSLHRLLDALEKTPRRAPAVAFCMIGLRLLRIACGRGSARDWSDISLYADIMERNAQLTRPPRP